MTKIGFFIRFTVAYTVVMALAGLFAGFLEMEEHASSLNAPILLGVSYWVFYTYTNKNGRLVEKREKWHLMGLALLGDVIATLLLGTPTMLANGLPIQYLVIGLLIAIPLHLLLFLFINYCVKKSIIKQRPELAES
ncbi:ABZJ_00895 family protein [Vibrio rhizosphaerae]|uniref:ABZJ_00895 family protein n=1 Tax=Vibrio rhizosphaerae TaxID=398736 RepID=A0ABU4ITI9_9VIBR|nr:ABZJ_00895 family protein [Vibrio rhizosphaerae]MDW6092594.1 ABZJ_00895 family protein [Vibrio rhizosphaerae]